MFSSDKVFEGFWINGKLNGEAIRFGPNNLMFTGTYKDGLEDGKGEEQFLDALTFNPETGIEQRDRTKFTGSYMLGKKEGEGKLDFENRDFYVGGFKQNRFHSYGIMNYTYNTNDTRKMYFGKWKEGKYNCQNGKLSYKDGTE